MYRSVRSEYFVAACLTTCILAGWLFYGVGLDAFLHAAYHGESLNYFNEFAARWRERQSSPSFRAFLLDARPLFFRLGVLGTFVATLLLGGILGSPDRVRGFFTAKTSPYNLALVRIILFGTLLAFDLSIPSSYAQLPTSLQFPPPGLSSVVPYLSVDPGTVSVASLLFQVACISGLFGFYSRTSAAVAALTGVYVLGVPQLYGKTAHYHHVLWFAGLFAVSPAGDVLSLDAVRRAWRSPEDSVPDPATAYARPLRFLWILLGLIYFFPGFWKFANEGLDWALSSNLKYRMHTLWFSAEQFRPLFRLDQYPLLYQSAALATIIFELGVLFTLPFKTLRAWAMGAALLFHQATHWFLNISFWSLSPFLFSLIDLRSVAIYVGHWLAPSPLHLEYDHDVPWQRRVAAVLHRFDLFDRLHTDPSSASSASVHVERSSGPALWQNGSPNPQSLLRLAQRVPAALPLFPLAWIVPSITSSVPDPSPNERLPTSHTRWPIMLVGSVLIAANVICGLGHVDSWPFSVYPTFAVRSDSLTTTIEITAVDTSGQSINVLSTSKDASALGLSPPRARGLARSILLLPDSQTRNSKLRALWNVWRQRNHALNSVSTVQFYEVVYPTSPPFQSHDPISKTQIATLSP